MQQLQIQTQILADSVMSGFCWAYANALLQKLKKLKKEKRTSEKQSNGWYLTDIAYSVVMELKGQISYDIQFNSYFQKEESVGVEIDRLVGVAEEFLAIFVH